MSSYSAQESGTLHVRTVGATFDVVLYVREDHCFGPELVCSSPELVADTEVTLAVVSGEEYLIVVDSFDEGGVFDLEFEFFPAEDPTDVAEAADAGSDAADVDALEDVSQVDVTDIGEDSLTADTLPSEDTVTADTTGDASDVAADVATDVEMDLDPDGDASLADSAAEEVEPGDGEGSGERETD